MALSNGASLVENIVIIIIIIIKVNTMNLLI